MSGKEVPKSYEQTQVAKQLRETYKKKEGNKSAARQFMEVPLLTLFKLRGDRQLKDFYLAGNLESAGKFGIVFRYLEDSNRESVVFLQAPWKHRANNVVSIKTFAMGGDWDLQKNFASFLMMQDKFSKSENDDPIYREKTDDLNCTLVIYTNAIADKRLLGYVDEVHPDNHPLKILLGKKCGHAFKLNAKAQSEIKHLKGDQYHIDIKDIETIKSDFFGKLTILIDQPNVHELEEIIKENISNVSDESTTIRYLKINDEMTKWWKQSGVSKYLKKGDDFLDKILGGVLFNLPNPLQSFIGRDEELKRLQDALLNNENRKNTLVRLQMASISGLGGIGKSQLARQYANNYRDSYNGNIIWIDAKTHNTMTDSFRKLCKNCLHIPTRNADKGEMPISSIVQNAYHFFKHQKCLFVFDNATEFTNNRNGNEGIKSFLPDEQLGIRLHFIITSRKQNWPIKINIQLNVFKDDEAEELLKGSLKIQDGRQDNDIKALVQLLGNFPLALQQAVAYIKQMDKTCNRILGTSFTIADYLKKYSTHERDLLAFKFPSDCTDLYRDTTMTTWNATLLNIEKSKLGKPAMVIVKIIAYLNPNDIPISFFTELLDNSHEKLIDVFKLIEGYSMITLHEGKANIQRLAQSVIRIALQGAEQQVILKKTLGLIRNHSEHYLIIQGSSVWNYANQDDDLVKEFCTIPAQIILALNKTVRYDQALEFGKQSLNSLKRVIGADHPSTLDTQHNVAKTMSNLGKYEDALCSYRDVLERKIKILGPDNPSTLTTQHNIAKTLSNQHMYEEALCSYTEVLKKKIKILGPDNPSTLTTHHNVAQTLSKQGKYEEALCSYREVLEKEINILGPDSPYNLTTQLNVAEILSDQGEYEEALCSYKRCLRNKSKYWGQTTHPP